MFPLPCYYREFSATYLYWLPPVFSDSSTDFGYIVCRFLRLLVHSPTLRNLISVPPEIFQSASHVS
ncbi:hypothetical protein L388_05514, partial [Klebsiella oxytoca MGH 42]